MARIGGSYGIKRQYADRTGFVPMVRVLSAQAGNIHIGFLPMVFLDRGKGPVAVGPVSTSPGGKIKRARKALGAKGAQLVFALG
jgi:hypothetical protein